MINVLANPDIFKIGEDDAAILETLAVGKRCLDIGTGTGRSSLALSQTARSVVSVDPEDFVVYHRYSVDYLITKWQDLELSNYNFDLAFIDHFGTRVDVACILLQAGISTVIIHDTKHPLPSDEWETAEERLMAAGATDIVYYDTAQGMVKATL
jgi:SAM-dependent methyltransferase